jgi:deferrochelatase/peroxidase EfeB
VSVVQRSEVEREVDIGRWEGASVVRNPAGDDKTEGGDPQWNNDFNYSDDKDQKKCPYAAHIRWVTPCSSPERSYSSSHLHGSAAR